MTKLRAQGAADLAANLLVDPDVRRRIERVLTVAGDTTAAALRMIGREAEWIHTLDFRCDPAGHHIDGLETAAVMDSHDDMVGSILVGCRASSVEHLSRLLTTLNSGHDLAVQEQAQEATNIIGSAYLNGLRTALLDLGVADAEPGYSGRSFLPSPPRFLKVAPEVMLELAVGGQGMGDRGWIADHRLLIDGYQIILVWVPSSEALVNLAVHDDSGVDV